MVGEADRFGGTCLNRGCVPSKMLVYTADVAQMVRHAGRFGIGAEWAGADWPAIRDRVFGRIDPLPDRAVAHRRANGIDVFRGEARFLAPRLLRVGDDEFRADRFVLATGSRPQVPGLAENSYLTSDTVMRLDTLPKSMAVLGGGYIAAEMSHVFGSLDTAVTIVERGQHLLSRQGVDIRARFTEHYRERFDLRLNSAVQRVSAVGAGVSLDLATPSGTQRVDSEVLLVATGRKPNSDLLDVAAAGIEVDAHGHVCTDDTMQTSVPGIWALGDLANHSQLTGSTRRSAMSRPASRIADVHVQVVARFDVEAAYCEGAAAAEPPAQVTALRAGLPAPKGPFPGRLVPPWLSGGPSS